jgi:hypothetical protein
VDVPQSNNDSAPEVLRRTDAICLRDKPYVGHPTWGEAKVEVMAKAKKRLSKELCSAKAKECRDLAMTATQKRHRIMLEDIAETWERIAKTAK